MNLFFNCFSLFSRFTLFLFFFIFFFNDTATTEIYTLSLHDALPILLILLLMPTLNFLPVWFALSLLRFRLPKQARSEERFSRNAETDIVCRLLLEKKKYIVNLIMYFLAEISSLLHFYLSLLNAHFSN